MFRSFLAEEAKPARGGALWRRGRITGRSKEAAMLALRMTLVAGISLAGWGIVVGAGEVLEEATLKAPSTVPGTDEPKERWVSLFNGRDLTGWYTFLQKHGKDRDPDHIIAIEDGTIHLYKDATERSDVVMGYIATEKE